MAATDPRSSSAALSDFDRLTRIASLAHDIDRQVHPAAATVAPMRLLRVISRVERVCRTRPDTGRLLLAIIARFTSPSGTGGGGGVPATQTMPDRLALLARVAPQRFDAFERFLMVIAPSLRMAVAPLPIARQHRA
jgi:hypothetical protein